MNLEKCLSQLIGYYDLFGPIFYLKTARENKLNNCSYYALF